MVKKLTNVLLLLHNTPLHIANTCTMYHTNWLQILIYIISMLSCTSFRRVYRHIH